ncbi:MAG: hypothetical protein WCJ97_07260 [Phycisphaerae bacterium]
MLTTTIPTITAPRTCAFESITHPDPGGGVRQQAQSELITLGYPPIP